MFTLWQTCVLVLCAIDVGVFAGGPLWWWLWSLPAPEECRARVRHRR